MCTKINTELDWSGLWRGKHDHWKSICYKRWSPPTHDERHSRTNFFLVALAAFFQVRKVIKIAEKNSRAQILDSVHFAFEKLWCFCVLAMVYLWRRQVVVWWPNSQGFFVGIQIFISKIFTLFLCQFHPRGCWCCCPLAPHTSAVSLLWQLFRRERDFCSVEVSC